MALRLLLVSLLLAGCDGARGHSHPVAGARQTLEEPSWELDPESEAARVGRLDFGAQRVEVEWRRRAMQKALWRDDHSAFAAALLYPVHVNTGSGCRAVVESETTFLAHYAQIVSPRMREAILHRDDLYFARDAFAVAGDAVWFPAGVRGFVFNTSVWAIPLLPCWREQPRAVPPELSSSWRLASRCDDGDPPAKPSWLAGADSLYFDFQNASVSRTSRSGATPACAIDRVSLAELDGRWPMSTQHCALWGSQPALTFYLDCRAFGDACLSQLSLIDGQLLNVSCGNVVSVFVP